MLETFAVENYRSLRDLVTPLGRLTVVTGANGSGKSNLYRALRLVADAAHNGAIASLAREGGLHSTLWAGPESFGRGVRAGEHPVQGTVRTAPITLRVGFASDDFGYAVDFGLPQDNATAFHLDPEIKRETVWAGPQPRRAATLVDRHRHHVWIREADGTRPDRPDPVDIFDSVLSEFTDPARAPELVELRGRIRSWRFYDQFRTDTDAPARQARVGTRTFALGQDGADLPAALQTITEVGDAARLADAVDGAFPGSRVDVVDNAGRFELAFHQHGLLRPLSGAELSDGTIRYLLWLAALLTPRPPALLVLNEPETSLHPRLLAPLAGLVADAARRTQVVTVSHSRPFIESLEERGAEAGVEHRTIELTKELGETHVVGMERFDRPPWQWPAR